MRKKRYISTFILFIVLNLISSISGFTNINTVTFNKETESISISITVEYLGNPLEGVVVSITDRGEILAKSTTDRKGRVTISIHNLGTKTVDLELKKEDYKTQILSGIILFNKSKYVFSLMKGTGVTRTEVKTAIPKIRENSVIAIQKIDQKIQKHLGKAKEYSLEADKENKKRRDIEQETAKVKRELQNTIETNNRLEEQLSQPINEGLRNN